MIFDMRLETKSLSNLDQGCCGQAGYREIPRWALSMNFVKFMTIFCIFHVGADFLLIPSNSDSSVK